MVVRSKVAETSTVVNQMTRKEFYMKIIIFVACVMLAIVDIFIFLFKTLGL